LFSKTTQEEQIRQIEELYLEKVKKGAVDEVRTLFQFSENDNLFQFDRDIVDKECDQSALTIAIINKHLSMCKLLLDHKVSLCFGFGTGWSVSNQTVQAWSHHRQPFPFKQPFGPVLHSQEISGRREQIMSYAAFTLNGFDDQARNLTSVKTDFQVLKLQFHACNFKQAFYTLHKLH